MTCYHHHHLHCHSHSILARSRVCVGPSSLLTVARNLCPSIPQPLGGRPATHRELQTFYAQPQASLISKKILRSSHTHTTSPFLRLMLHRDLDRHTTSLVLPSGLCLTMNPVRGSGSELRPPLGTSYFLEEQCGGKDLSPSPHPQPHLIARNSGLAPCPRSEYRASKPRSQDCWVRLFSGLPVSPCECEHLPVS